VRDSNRKRQFARFGSADRRNLRIEGCIHLKWSIHSTPRWCKTNRPPMSANLGGGQRALGTSSVTLGSGQLRLGLPPAHGRREVRGMDRETPVTETARHRCGA
jgi:hypothetical protein